MKKIRKYFTGALLLAAALLTSCAKTQEKPQSEPKNEEALTVLIRSHSSIEDALKEKFPDIPLVFDYYDGPNATSNMQMRIKNHDISDIFMGTLKLDEKDSVENLLDLSGYAFCNNYENSILNQYDINGSIYQLPNALTIRCIIYNKEMFDAHGWKEPLTFGELTALCRQIRKETEDVTPIVFGGAGIGYYFTTMTTYAQTEFLYTPEGNAWEKDYLVGKVSCKEGFQEGIQMTQELIDAGAFDYEKNKDLWDRGVFRERMETGEAAMQFAWGGQDQLFGVLEGNEKKYAVMPFRNYNGDAFLGTNTNYHIGLSKKLKEAGNEKKLKNALRIMEWFSTEEGQSQLTTVNGSIIYPLKNAKNKQIIPQFRELWNQNLDGIKAPMLYTGYEDILIQTAEYIIEAVKGEHTLDGLVELIDELHRSALVNNDDKEVYVGSFSEDFTHEETVQTIVEILHDKGDSDITLVSDGKHIGNVQNVEGAHSKFYKGSLFYDWIRVFLPGGEHLDKPMVQMKLTGKQIQELLEKGKHMVLYEGHKSSSPVAYDEEATDASDYPYYWAGMTAKFVRGKVTSMKLADGTPIKADKRYTVSFANDDYMDTTAEAGNPKELGYSVYEVFCDYMKKNSPVSPIGQPR